MKLLDHEELEQICIMLTVFKICISQNYKLNPLTQPHGLKENERKTLEHLHFAISVIMNDLRIGEIEEKQILDQQAQFPLVKSQLSERKQTFGSSLSKYQAHFAKQAETSFSCFV